MSFQSSSVPRRSSSPDAPTSIFMDGMTLSLSIFSISAVCFVKYIVQPQQRPSPLDRVPFLARRRKSLQNLRFDDRPDDHHNRSSSGMIGSNVNVGHDHQTTNIISKRGTTALLPAIPYQNQFFTALNVRWSACSILCDRTVQWGWEQSICIESHGIFIFCLFFVSIAHRHRIRMTDITIPLDISRCVWRKTSWLPI